MARWNPKAEHLATVVAGCSPQVVLVVAVAEKEATAVVAGWVEAEARWVAVAGLVTVTADLGWVGAMEAEEETGWAEAVDLAVVGQVEDLAVTDSAAARVVEAMAAVDLEAAVEETGLAVAAMAADWAVAGWVEVMEEEAPAAVAAVAWAAAESCVWRPRTSTLYRSKTQPCSCTELQ